MVSEKKTLAELDTAPEDTAVLQPASWGPFTAVIGGFLLYLVPQILILIVIIIVLGEDGLESNTFVNENEVLFNTMIYGVAELLTVFFLLQFLRYKSFSIKAFGLARDGLSKIWYAIPAFGVYFLITISLTIISGFFLSDELLNQQQELGLGDVISQTDRIVAFISLVLIAPFVEELLFRGFVFKGLRSKMNFVAAMLISSVLFGVAHFQLNVGLDTFALALVLAYLVEKTGSLWPSIALHALKNLIAFTALFIFELQ